MTVISFLRQNWENDGISFYATSNMYSLVEGISTIFEDLADDVQDIYNSQHINSATGKELEKFGYMVNLPREQGESDNKYRVRIKLQYRLNFIEGTFDEVTEFILVLLDATTDQVRFERRFDADPGALYVSADTSVYTNSPLSQEEIVEFASRVVSAGHKVKIEQEGTFVLIGEGDTVQDPATGLAPPDESSGGTLSSTL